MKLSNRTVLVTGGSAGIGLAFARKFLELGNEVIVTGRRQSVLDEVRAKYPALHTIQSDVSVSEQNVALAERIKREFPRLDLLINNAGTFDSKNLTSSVSNPEGLMTEIDVNVGGVIRMTSALLDLLKINRGAVVNISSLLAIVPLPSAPIYSASKAAIHSYTQSLRFQLKDVGVAVFEIMPPLVKTDMTAGMPETKGTKFLSPEQLVDLSIAGLKADKEEIKPGQTGQVAFLNRLMPGLILSQFWKMSKPMIPAKAE